MAHQWDIYIPISPSIMGFMLLLQVLKVVGHGRQQFGNAPGYCVLGKRYLSTHRYEYRSFLANYSCSGHSDLTGFDRGVNGRVILHPQPSNDPNEPLVNIARPLRLGTR